MPEADSTPEAATSEARVGGPLLPEHVWAVVERWHPQGTALLRALDGSGSVAGTGNAIQVYAPDDVNTSQLRTELARFTPRLRLSDPSVHASPGVALVVCDAGHVLGAAALTSIERLNEQGHRVVIAMNGTHAHPEWPVVQRRNKEMLAARGPAGLPVHAVSARLAAAGRAGDSQLLDRSGLAALHAELISALGSGPVPGSRDAVVARVLAETRGRIVEQAGELRSDTTVERLRAERTALLASRDGGRATALTALRSRAQLARMELLTETGTRVRSLHTAARADIDTLSRAAMPGYPERLQVAVRALTADIDGLIEQRIGELALQFEVDRPAARRWDPPPDLGPDPLPRRRGVEDHIMIVLGASAGVGLGRLAVAPLSLVPALDVASVPLALVLGAGAAAWVVRARGQLSRRSHLVQWAGEALVNVKAQLEQRIAAALVDAESELSEQVVQTSTDRALAVDRQAAELEVRLRRVAAERPGRLAACERDVEIIDRATG